MKIGYARVSTQEQNIGMQIADLEDYGCEQIFREKLSASKERPELDKMLAHIREGDTVIVWKLDRLGRSMRHLVNMLADFESRGVEFISLKDHINTTSPQGRLVFNIFACLAEYEREMISERTKAGLRAARLKGHFSGRPKGLSKQAKKTAYLAESLSKDDSWSVGGIVKQLKISRTTYYRYLEWAKANPKFNGRTIETN